MCRLSGRDKLVFTGCQSECRSEGQLLCVYANISHTPNKDSAMPEVKADPSLEDIFESSLHLEEQFIAEGHAQGVR